MGYLIAAVVIIVVLVAVGWLVARRRQQPTAASTPADARTTAPRPEPAPMTGLEDALAAATDRSGRTIAQNLDDKSSAVDELRVTDDTGPLLRRALDNVKPAHDRASHDADATQPDTHPEAD